jgi:ribonuclease E
LRTNLEAADEVARQLRLRDLAGLIVIDFIDMEENRNNAAVERRMKEALKNDRARIQIGRISSFGLLEMSRQRLHPSLAEASTEICPHCAGTGRIRSVDSTALHVMRMVEEEITRSYSPGVVVKVPAAVALYILNQKRASLAELEQRRGVRIYLEGDESLIPPDYRLERIKQLLPGEEVQQLQLPPITVVEEEFDAEDEIEVDEDETAENEADDADEAAAATDGNGQGGEGRGRRRRRRRRNGRGERLRADEFTEATEAAPAADGSEQPVTAPAPTIGDEGAVDEDDDGHDDGDEDELEATGDAADGDQPRRRRRRGRRGGRRRSRRPQDELAADGTEGEPLAEDGSRPQADTADDAAAQDSWVAGTGDQPNLPDILPVYWQQQAPAITETAADSPVTARSSVDSEESAGETTTQPTTGDVAVADQATTRRRSRREDGERPARTRKPRRSRDEAASEVAAGEAGLQSNDNTAEAPAAEPAATVPPAVEHTYVPTVQAAEPSPVQSAPVVSTPVPPTVEPIDTGSGATADVTVIGEDASTDDSPKRRGWWRRLME